MLIVNYFEVLSLKKSTGHADLMMDLLEMQFLEAPVMLRQPFPCKTPTKTF